MGLSWWATCPGMNKGLFTPDPSSFWHSHQILKISLVHSDRRGSMPPPSFIGVSSINDDGSIIRAQLPTCPADPSFLDGVASKDVIIDTSTHVWVRIFLPQPAQSKKRFPVVLYFHGGGFVFFSVAYKPYHRFLNRLAREAGVIVVAVDYRLAPEHRLPAAYEDARTSLKWVRSQAMQGENSAITDEWLVAFADFSRFFLMGDSAGGNIVHHLSIWAGRSDIRPLGIVAQILIEPFFGGVVRTATELSMANDKYVPLAGNDWLWSVSLPEGANRDHPASNPVGPLSPDLTAVRLPRTLVMVALKDPMHERQLQYFVKLKEAGVDAQSLEYEDAVHGFQLMNVPKSTLFLQDLIGFLRTCRLSNL